VTVTPLDRLPEKTALAKEQVTEAGLRDRVEIIDDDAGDSLAGLEGEFDLVFLDADRGNYVGYLPRLVELLRSDGLLVTDNVTSHPGEVAAFLEAVRADARLATVTLPIGKGEEVTLKL
jgi:predicted O-methyltransferase YrrM